MIRTACSTVGRMLHVRMLSFLHSCCNLHCCCCCCYNLYAVVAAAGGASAATTATFSHASLANNDAL